jgi:hypothetical protein
MPDLSLVSGGRRDRGRDETSLTARAETPLGEALKKR